LHFYWFVVLITDNDGPYYWHIKSGTIQRDPPKICSDQQQAGSLSTSLSAVSLACHQSLCWSTLWFAHWFVLWLHLLSNSIYSTWLWSRETLKGPPWQATHKNHNWTEWILAIIDKQGKKLTSYTACQAILDRCAKQQQGFSGMDAWWMFGFDVI